MSLIIYRNSSPIYEVDIDESTVHSAVFMSEDVIKASFITYEIAPIQEGDYIVWEGNQYTINQPVGIERLSSTTHRYTVDFEADIYKMYDKVFTYNGDVEFSYFGTAAQLLNLIIAELNKLHPLGQPYWSVDSVSTTDPKLVLFSNADGYTCRTALTYICEQFEVDCRVNKGKISLLKRVGTDTNIVFEYGRGNGLYSLKRETPEDQKSFNRLWIYGGDRNLPQTYRNGSKRLKTSDAASYVQKPLAAGEQRREATMIFDDIYPTFTGTVTDLGSTIQEFFSTSIDFDLNGYQVTGDATKVVFKTGALAGLEFELASYVHADKKVKINNLTEKNGEILPKSTRRASVGDTFTFINIALPNTYIQNAENRLTTAGTAELNKQYVLPYTLVVNEKFIRDNNITLTVGDTVRVMDDEYGVDANIRIQSISYPLVNKGAMVVELADGVVYNTTERIIIKQIQTETRLTDVDKQRMENARTNALGLRKLRDLLLDPDGYFDSTSLKPNSIESLYLSVGAKSQNFALNGVVVTANYLGSPNSIRVTAGALIHHEISIVISGIPSSTWVISSPTGSDSLDPSKVYYVSVRCSKTSNVGAIIIDENFTKTEQYPGFYYFNMGVLYTVANGVRYFAQTHGVTTIVGDQITTGRVKDISGQNYFDVLSGKFNLGNTQYGLDWNVTNPNRLTIRGSLVQNAGGASALIPLDRGIYSPSSTYYAGDTVLYDGATYMCLLDSTIGVTPSNTSPWKVFAQKGATGATGAAGTNGTNGTNGVDGIDGEKGPLGPSPVYRGVYDPLKTYYGTEQRVDIVKYDGAYYHAQYDADVFSGIAPAVGGNAKWSEFGANFESIATGLLFAELAYIDNLGVRNLATGTGTGKRIVLNEETNSLRFYSGDLGSGIIDVEIDDEVYEYDSVGPMPSLGAGIIARGPIVTGSVKAYSALTSKGMKANGSDLSIGGTGKASMIASLMKSNSISGAPSYALYAADYVNSSTTYAAEFAGKTRFSGGVYNPIRFVNQFLVNVLENDWTLIAGSSCDSLYLPSSPLDGHVLNFRNGAGKSLKINGNGRNLINESNVAEAVMTIPNNWKGTIQFSAVENRWFIIS